MEVFFIKVKKSDYYCKCYLVSVFSLTAGDFHQAFFLGCRIFKYDEVYNFLAKKVAKFCNDTQTEHGRRNVKKYW